VEQPADLTDNSPKDQNHRPHGDTLVKVTAYGISGLILLVALGCGGGMRATKAKLVQPVAEQSAPEEISARSEEYFSDGLSLFRAGQDEAAAGYFVQALQVDSSNWKAHYYLALVRRKSSETRSALASLHAALTFAPQRGRDRSMIYLALGELFEELKDFSRALLSYRTALNLYPGSERARAGLNRVEQLTQQSQK
jgi:Tfp pilus assembly protein PilF